jgi:hypothetical protein
LKKIYTVFLFAIFLIHGQLFSQDTIRIGNKTYVKAHWSGFFNVSGFIQKGNTDKIYAVSSGEIKRADGVLESIAFVSLGYGESEGIKDDNELSSSLTFDLFYDNILSPFVLQLTGFSFAREIVLRSQSGGGLKYTFVDIPEFKSSISAAGIYDYTNLKDKPGNNDSRTWRLSARFKFKSALFGGRINISHVTFYQPSFKNFTNAIWWSETGIGTPLTDFLDINATYNVTHEDVVPEGVKKTDQKVVFGLGIEFK